MPEIILPKGFTKAEKAVILDYLENVGPGQNWPKIIRTFNRLREGLVAVPGQGRRTFASVYTHLIDAHLMDPFIEALYQLDDVAKGNIKLWARGARQIAPMLRKAGLYFPDDPPTRLLLAYCLYWWHATAKGYAFEVEIFCDLQHAGIDFVAHNIRQRAERLAAYDLQVSQFLGDVKTSTYFLTLVSKVSVSDFYITRLWLSETRTRTLVVFLKSLMWDEIDGDTLLVAWHELETGLSKPVRIVHGNGELVVADYEQWKDKMRAYQTRQEQTYG
jgi:hypothetical protein